MKKELPQRKHPRSKIHDYSSPGAYFITICTHQRRCILSRINGSGIDHAKVILSPYGQIAKEELTALENRYSFVKIDQCVIMPNHIHLILILTSGMASTDTAKKLTQLQNDGNRPTVMDIICTFKSIVTKRSNTLSEHKGAFFQSSFYDHVIRNKDDYLKTCKYIEENPAKWQEDEHFYPEN